MTARVLVRPSSPGALPEEVRVDVDARIAWLRDELLPELDRELGVPFPPVHVMMTSWIVPTFQHPRATVAAIVGLYHHGDRDRWVVVLTAAALRTRTDGALRGLLAHEFLHVVYRTRESLNGFRAGRVPTFVDHGPDYWNTAEGYQRGEAATLASPDWLSPRLRTLCADQDRGALVDPGETVDPRIWRLPWPATGPRDAAPPRSPAPTRFSLDSLDPQLIAKLDARAATSRDVSGRD